MASKVLAVWTNPGDENPFKAPESGASFADYELPERLELYPICVVTGSNENLREVTQTIECGPWPIRVLRRCADLTTFLFLGQTLMMANVAPLRAMNWFLMIFSGATAVSLLCFVLWRKLRDRTTVTFFVREDVWRKDQRQRRLWAVGAVGLITVLIVLAVNASSNPSVVRNAVKTMAPTLLLLGVYVSFENASRKFSPPALIKNQGQPMLQLSRVYHEMAKRVEEQAEPMTDEDAATRS